MLDYHIHSTLSADAHDTIAALCRRSVEIGLREICFTEHVDFDPRDNGYGFYDHDAYRAAIQEARSEFDGRLAIRMGVEVDYHRNFDADVRRWLGPLSEAFDFVMGSVHYVGPDAVFLGYRDEFRNLPLAELYEHYLRDTIACIETGLFDGIGHFDYLRRQGSGVYERVEPLGSEGLFDEAIAAAVESGVSLDINTKHDLDGSPQLRVPTLETLRRFVELGGRHVTVGSDTHEAANLGRGLRGALNAARLAGLSHVTTYNARRRVMMPIAECDNWEDPS